MKNYLSGIDLAMWMVLIVGKLVLCLCIVKKRFGGLRFPRLLPWFSALVFISSSRSLALFVLAFWASYSTYYYVFYTGSYFESALAFLTLIECGRRVLPGLNLPQKEKAFAWLGVSLAAVIIFASVWPLNFLETRLEVGAYLAIAVTFIFIAIYSRYLGLYWARLVAGVTATLGLLYLVEGVTRVMIGHYAPALVVPVRQLSQIANVLAVIAWIVVVLSPWGVREMTEADLLKIEAAFARIEASLGTGGVKTV